MLISDWSSDVCSSDLAGTTGLGVEHDGLGHVQIGRRVHVDVAVAGAGLDGGHLSVADDGVEQASTAARDHHVDAAASLDQVGANGKAACGERGGRYVLSVGVAGRCKLERENTA